MGDPAPHDCRFVPRLEWGEWVEGGEFRERDGRRVQVCATCGRKRPSRRRRAPEMIEKEARVERAAPERDPESVIAADVLRRRTQRDAPGWSARGFLGETRRRGLPRSAAEDRLERLLSTGWLRLRWRVRGTRRELVRIELRDPAAVSEFARPGELAARRAALAAALAAVQGTSHPVSAEVRELLAGPEAERLDPRVVRALAAIAVHVDRGEVLALRAFSAQHLDDSKLLARLRRRLEMLIGPLEVLGIRDGATLTLLGGRGRVHLDACALALDAVGPFLGLPSDALMRAKRIEFPSAGVLVVENLTTFEACCRGEVSIGKDVLVVWSAGYPGRPVRHIVDLARGCGAPVQIWADLDLDGVRIARLLFEQARPHAALYRMTPDDVRGAPAARPLSPRARRLLAEDLEAYPDAVLAETVRAILDRGEWVEQETMLTGGPATMPCGPTTSVLGRHPSS